MADPNYVVGRGKLYFRKFLPGTRTLAPGGMRYLGNSPEVSLSQDEEKLAHYSSDSGIKVKDAEISLQNDSSGSFALDDIQPENLALWFRGDVENNVIAGGAVVDEAHADVSPGEYVQLGLSTGNPIGARNVSAVTVKIGATTITMAGNYEIDAVTGRMYIVETAPDIPENSDLLISYTAAAGTEEVVVAAGTVIEGRLEFFADNAAGANRDYIWPCVQISPDGDFSLKGDEWQQMNFSLEILKLNDSTARQYIVKR